MVVPKAFSHIGLRAADVDSTTASLEHLIGVNVVDRGEITNADWERDVQYATLELADKTIFVVHPTPYEAAGLVEPLDPGIAHYGVEVDSIDAALDDWSDDTVLMEPFDLGDTRYAFCTGPDNTRIELVESLTD
ncbi:Glyoxalase/Bleomycin resistance protein/Dioxygenase superfamily protein [Halopelagius inordinatus]|uniref:Glyoxalase/Bleomycin resistance protein/Dioxygenase superfamily protein n=1 Tax=Halopelagius inordinatus TaxID=553467 RepID=A0A1I2VBJ0_9EURY|nr:VOC family protein [Halopelagius inordinatus]SFG85809.1 Glyoxalase/Bleomycin resistance protein/Dioxygenase superfamily protein [Halopelagius inordinatus]